MSLIVQNLSDGIVSKIKTFTVPTKDMTEKEIEQDIKTHCEIINFYRDNFKNNLHCCDVVVAKLY